MDEVTTGHTMRSANPNRCAAAALQMVAKQKIPVILFRLIACGADQVGLLAPDSQGRSSGRQYGDVAQPVRAHDS